uniref:Uncharacterized protein n=1 Tax=Zooxanthella nutricula TaxID=1333877 RepID=A0A7S2KQN7_9DINO|mmetsp:Transcript_50871/g.154754  ORF Transcript_50871/g.154754 Transcript_50871/m.154754 type:complete len:106 (+) Transcript_50871:247-564(+)
MDALAEACGISKQMLLDRLPSGGKEFAYQLLGGNYLVAREAHIDAARIVAGHAGWLAQVRKATEYFGAPRQLDVAMAAGVCERHNGDTQKKRALAMWPSSPRSSA